MEYRTYIPISSILLFWKQINAKATNVPTMFGAEIWHKNDNGLVQRKSHSFIYSSVESLGGSRPRRTQNTSLSTAISVLLAKAGWGKVGDVITLPGPWTTSGRHAWRFSQQDLPRQSFLGHSGHVAQATQLQSLRLKGDVSRHWMFYEFHIWALCRSFTPWTVRKKHLCRLHVGTDLKSGV